MYIYVYIHSSLFEDIGSMHYTFPDQCAEYIFIYISVYISVSISVYICIYIRPANPGWAILSPRAAPSFRTLAQSTPLSQTSALNL